MRIALAMVIAMMLAVAGGAMARTLFLVGHNHPAACPLLQGNGVQLQGNGTNLCE